MVQRSFVDSLLAADFRRSLCRAACKEVQSQRRLGDPIRTRSKTSDGERKNWRLGVILLLVPAAFGAIQARSTLLRPVLPTAMP